MQTSFRQRGFTVIELMVVIAVVAVVLMVAAPSFREQMQMQRIRATHDELMTNIQYARSEAVARGTPVHVRLQPSDGVSAACYIIFTDSNREVDTWSPSCNCKSAAGSRCSAATTAEIKTVSTVDGQGISFSLSGDFGDRFAFDPTTAGLVVKESEDRMANAQARFQFNLLMDAARSITTLVSVPGRVTACATAGSRVPMTSC